MTYVQGFVLAVPAANKQAYVQHARTFAKMFLQWGATRVVETWGADVPTGKVTDFYQAVAAKEGEVIVFSWIEFPDKAAADAMYEKMMADPAMSAMTMPFDGSRMIFGGFESLLIEE